MWSATISRDELIALIQREELKNQSPRPVASLLDLERVSKGLVVVWRERPDDRSLPNLLLIPEKEKRDFFAWASSYVKIKPLTAFMRTVDFETLTSISVPPPNNDRWQRGLTGLILAEALTYLDRPSVKLPLRACEGTYSFATARSLLRVLGPMGVRQTGLNWFRSREALGNKAPRLALVHLQNVWSVIAELAGSDLEDPTASQTIVRSCRNLFQFGDLSDADWRALTKDIPVYDLRVVMRNTREERVIVLENFLRSLGSRESEKEEIPFLVGYLVSMVAPGTLDHWRLLNPIRQSLPTAGLWYGLCAGIRPETPIESSGAGVGRLVIRELQRKVDLLEQPSCDIAVDELDVTGPFFKSEGAAGSNTVEVEVSPGISVPFRSNGTDQLRPEVPLDSVSSRPPEPSLDPRILDNLDDALFALEEVRRAIQKTIPNSSRSYYSKPRKKRPTR